MIVRHSLIAGGRALNRTARKFFILGPWMLFVIVLVSTFYDPPPQDDNEYQKWAFASFFGTAMPWIFCSIPVLLIADSLETRKRSRRVWITTMWTLLVICVAWICFQPVFRASAFDLSSLDSFSLWLGGLLFILWIVLEAEKILVDRGWLT